MGSGFITSSTVIPKVSACGRTSRSVTMAMTFLSFRSSTIGIADVCLVPMIFAASSTEAEVSRNVASLIIFSIGQLTAADRLPL